MRCRPLALAHCTLRRLKGSLISRLRAQPAAQQQLRNPARTFPERAERKAAVLGPQHALELLRTEIGRAHRIAVGLEALALDRRFLGRTLLEPDPLARELLREPVELAKLLLGDRLLPRKLRVSRVIRRHGPALGPFGLDAVGGEELAGAGTPGDPEESVLVRGDRVSVPELAPARAGHGEPEAAVGIGAHVVQRGSGRSVGLCGLLAQYAVLDDRASASALARRGPADLDAQLRKRLRSL